ncbi:MAG: aminopeptidase P family protein [Defluviitaleaceae bacterium]|nr:aminopeptidase P family protein [Defluviitaleaceae bacterium]
MERLNNPSVRLEGCGQGASALAGCDDSRAQKLAHLRSLMAERGFDAYIIPSGDAHASEYVADFWRARQWISGFSGSAGLVVVTPNEAGLWTDGRYFIQAERELAGSEIKLFKMQEPDVPTYQAFLAEKIPQNGSVAFDGHTITTTSFKTLKDKLREKGAIFSHGEDLIGQIWRDRPPLPREKAFEHAVCFAGKNRAEKLADVRGQMSEKKIAAYLVTALDSVAWLLNLRGRDIAGLPVVYAFVFITQNEARLFIDAEKIEGLHLPEYEIHKYDALSQFLKNHSLKNSASKKIFFNPHTTSVLLSESIEAEFRGEFKPSEEIIPRLKAVKTPHELAQIKNAFIKEGVAMTKTLFWLENAMAGKVAAGALVTEGDVVRVLQKFRAEQADYLCDSFDTVSAYGANAAEAHYTCGETGATLRPEGFLLLDTGGQYLDGTTDTTRTIPLGALTDDMRRDYTLVLKGHIALARAVFLKGTTGTQLDILARLPLWQTGQNYSHGTGHGIGFCLSVHEGPHNISTHHNAVALEPGMLLTNEPALYKAGRYGIRTENVLCVRAKRAMNPDDMCRERRFAPKPDSFLDFLEFEILTICPIDTRAILSELLNETEREWLETYNKTVRETLSPYLSDAERAWMQNLGLRAKRAVGTGGMCRRRRILSKP